MKIDIYNFKSAITAVEPELISESYATDALNVETIKGSIESIKVLSDSNEVAVSNLTNSITRISFRDSVNKLVQGVGNDKFVTSPLAQDDFDRVYITSETNPPQLGSYSTIETVKVDLGINAPANPIIVTDNGTGDDTQQASFLFVEESAYGELSAPSSATLPVMFKSDGNITLAMPDAPTSGHWTHRRIYISDFSGNYLYYKTILNTQATEVIAMPFDFTTLGEELDQLVSGDLNDKPRAGMQGLCSMPGGFLAGYEDNVVCFSKAYLPHAWPSNYEITVNGVIQAISVAASGLVVLTDKKPYLIAGGSPDAMYPVELDISEPLFSRNAVVDMGSYVIYPSSDGLIAVAGEDNRNIIQGIMDKDEWRNYLSSDAVACLFNGKYWYFTNNGGFVFDVQDKSFTRHTMSAIAVYGDQLNDTIYIVNPIGDLFTYSRSNPVSNTFTWKSKLFTIDSGSLSCFKIDSESTVDIEVEYIDYGSVISTHTATSQPYKANRLPSIKSQQIRFTVSSDSPIKRIQLASSMQEFG